VHYDVYDCLLLSLLLLLLLLMMMNTVYGYITLVVNVIMMLLFGLHAFLELLEMPQKQTF